MTRAKLFWRVCIPTRAAIALVAMRHNPRALRLAALVIGARWVLGLENGHEGYFGGPVWWAEERGAHGALWTAYALCGDGRLLALDTALGAGNWVWEHSK